MRDSRIGTYGTLALIFSVGVRVAAIAALAAPFWSVLGIAVLSRFAMVVVIERMPTARSEGLGSRVSDGPSQLGLAAVFGLSGVFFLGLAAGFFGLAVLLFMMLAGLAFARLANQHIGGQTGDVLGAIQQTTEIAGLIALSALAN